MWIAYYSDGTTFYFPAFDSKQAWVLGRAHETFNNWCTQVKESM